jgi:hypothetical protein
MTYGYEVRGRHDRMLDVSIQLNKFVDVKVYAFATLITGFPFLRHIPAWVPYISFKPLAQIGRSLGEEVVNKPMRFVKESIVSDGPGGIVISVEPKIFCDRPVAQRVLHSPSNISKISTK